MGVQVRTGPTTEAPISFGAIAGWTRSTGANIRKLAPVWAFQTGVEDGGLQATPIVVDGIMYLSSSWNRVFAINAQTGQEIWHYYYENPRQIGIIYSPMNRGVAVSRGRVFMGTLDNHVVALDQKTGRELWKVNVEDMRQCGCNITGAPLVVRDKVIVGVTGGDSAHRGYLSAFDTRTDEWSGVSTLSLDPVRRDTKPGRGTVGSMGAEPPG